jgi:Mrp family chromosome partitioning ATPase
MERITRALELARAQRGKAPTEPPIEPGIPLAGFHGAAGRAPSEQARASHAAGEHTADHGSDSVIFRSPIIEVGAPILERERILPPGATGPVGSSYKMLRTQVQQRMDRIGANTLAVLGPTAGAGKTLTAINLAIAMAASEGRTVLLVDLDLRNPSIHKRFGFQPEVGVEDCLEKGVPVQHALVKVAGYDRLTLLPARAPTELSSELLADERAERLIAELRNRYSNRTLVFDVPPVLQSDDALTLTRNVQAGLMVVREGRTRREDVTRSMELLRALTIVGTVLNDSRDRRETSY